MKLLLILHLVITVVYALVVIPIQKRTGAAKAVMALCMPYLGVGILLISDLALAWKRPEKYDYSQLIHEDDTEILEEYNENDDALLVPVNDALFISNATTKRKVVLNILKKDAKTYVPQLKMALGDDDTETAHYAAAALVELKGEYDNRVDEGLLKINQNPDDPQPIYELIQVLYEYIHLDILDFVIEKKYAVMLIEHAHMAQVKFGTLAFETHYKFAKVALRIRHAEVRKTLLSFLNDYPDNEEPYILLINYCYQQRDPQALETAMQQLGKSKVLLSKEMLELMRFYRNGEEYFEI